ncbi:MAG: AraC family transcriptional regulator [Pseudomonadota bacterium]
MHQVKTNAAVTKEIGVHLQKLPAGKVSLAPQKRHLLAIHVGAPVRACCRLDGRTQHRLQMPGDIDIVPAGVSGDWEDEAPCSVLTVSLSQALVAATAERMNLATAQQIRPRLQVRDKRIEHIAWALKAEVEASNGHASGALYLESLGIALAAHLLSTGAGDVPAQLPATASAGRQMAAHQLHKVIAYIENNLAADLSLAQLAAVAGLSISHFKLLFRQSTGFPAHQYVIRRRVEYAKELIMCGQQEMSQAALRAGFSHQSHMARCMRQVLGILPGELGKHNFIA